MTLSLAATGFVAGSWAPETLLVSKVGNAATAESAAAFFKNDRLEASFGFRTTSFEFLTSICILATASTESLTVTCEPVT